MKVHYINILLFAHALNILLTSSLKENAYTKPYITSHHTPKIPSTRRLCECELYAPDNYDNDPQMKMLMQQFEDRASQRFHEYDERMKTTRQKCKDRCDKEIQKIILKDRLEKELMDKFATLDTHIQNEAIPTCICEKSLADKVEINCLKCTYGLGTVAPCVGLIGGKSVYISANYNIINAFIAKTIQGLNDNVPLIARLFGEEKLAQIVTPAIFRKPTSLYTTIVIEKQKLCACSEMKTNLACHGLESSYVKNLPLRIEKAVEEGMHAANEMLATPTTANAFLTNPIILSAIAILVIVLIMVIIYLILRHRRKKKMKRKLQYMKLLEE
ncbi:rifin PIR protein,putative [Plasmodium sp. DRC-Itaito]|nr:rifin PIR protein,putative [Plasmodium sp. DRC-Itaito]